MTNKRNYIKLFLRIFRVLHCGKQEAKARPDFQENLQRQQSGKYYDVGSFHLLGVLCSNS